MKQKNNKVDMKKLSLIIIAAVVVVVIAFSFPKEDKGKNGNSLKNPVVKDNDIVIQSADVTEEPGFYPARINDVDVEVIAVKASDGTIRTAFNTCQVCYGSGKGYYEVAGDKLVCQNCGNRFGMDDIEVTRGGCNPVPITSEYKTVSDDTITITKDLLTQATEIFANWK